MNTYARESHSYKRHFDQMASIDALGSTELWVRMLVIGVPLLVAYFAYDLAYPLIWFVIYGGALLLQKLLIAKSRRRIHRAWYWTMVIFNAVIALIFIILPCMLWLSNSPILMLGAVGLSLGSMLHSMSQRTKLPLFALGDALANSVFFVLVGVSLAGNFSAFADGVIVVVILAAMLFYYLNTLWSIFRVRTNLKIATERSIHAQKMEAMGRLTGGIAHDFNNILTVVKGNLELYKEVEDKAEQDYLAAEAFVAAQKAEKLTAHLLGFSRQAILVPQPIDLTEFISEFSTMVRRLLPENIDFQSQIPPDIWAVHADRTQFESALLNLVINARDAMPDGGEIRLAADRFVVGDVSPDLPQQARPGRYVRLTVSDTGHGISKTLQTQVFDPFFTTKDVGKGSGLGLSMAKGFTEQSKGWLDLFSEPGMGTVITIILPVAGEPRRGANDH